MSFLTHMGVIISPIPTGNLIRTTHAHNYAISAPALFSNPIWEEKKNYIKQNISYSSIYTSVIKKVDTFYRELSHL